MAYLFSGTCRFMLATAERVGYDASENCATTPVANTLMAALPSELRVHMKPMTIYTDNVGAATNTVRSCGIVCGQMNAARSTDG